MIKPNLNLFVTDTVVALMVVFWFRTDVPVLQAILTWSVLAAVIGLLVLLLSRRSALIGPVETGTDGAVVYPYNSVSRVAFGIATAAFLFGMAFCTAIAALILTGLAPRWF
jgi:hypothetical protein